MNRLHIISSGSKANSYLLETDGEMILIDQGLSFKRFNERCGELGVDPGRIKAILVTHEHTDHIKGVPLTAKKLEIPIFASDKIIDLLNSKHNYSIDIFPMEKDRLNVKEGFTFIPFSVMHDAIDPLGFSIFLSNGEKVSIATDTGMITNHMMRHLSESSYLIIEANHDRGLLYKNPKYPWELKERIKGNYGHLSNEQCLDAIDRMATNRLKKVVMSHLSEENNNTKLLKDLIDDFSKNREDSFQSFIATQNNPFSILMN